MARWAFTAFDIDISKQLQMATMASEQYFKRLANWMPQMVWRADPWRKDTLSRGGGMTIIK